MLQCAASLGFETSKTILASAAGLGEKELNQALGALATAGLVGVVRTGPDIEIVFPDADAHAAAAQARSAETDRDALGRAIEAIETGRLNRLDEYIEILARFALNAELWDKAAAFCRRASEKAQGRAAAPEAVAHLEAALTGLARLPKSRETDEQTVDVHLALSAADRAMGRFEQMMAHLHEAQTLASAMEDPVRIATVKVYETNVQNLLGRFDDAVVTGRHALELAEAVGDPALIGGAYAALGQSYLFSCDNRRLIEVFSRYLAYIDGGGKADKTEKSDAA